MTATVVNLTYLLSAILFIVGLKGLSHPRSAVRGNITGSLGMLLAIVATLVGQEILNPVLIVVGLGLGALIGAVFALKIKMTAMPQLVGLYNGFGGIASVLVAGAVLYQSMNTGLSGAGVSGPSASGALQFLIATVAGGLIGGVTFF